jgi:hypothetical protein
MRNFFGTAFAAALASLLGLGPSAGADLSMGPSAYQATTAAAALPIWLVRFKLRQRGYQDITDIDEAGEGLAVRALDRWGRPVKILVDRLSGAVLPRAGYGLAHLRGDELERRLASLGLEPLAPASYRDRSIRVLARDAGGQRHMVRIDPVTGTAWFARADLGEA